jgi:hypothetical protein
MRREGQRACHFELLSSWFQRFLTQLFWVPKVPHACMNVKVQLGMKILPLDKVIFRCCVSYFSNGGSASTKSSFLKTRSNKYPFVYKNIQKAITK